MGEDQNYQDFRTHLAAVCDRVGLKPAERQVMLGALWARIVVTTGLFLPSPGRQRAARRLVDRRFLTAGELLQPAGWMPVKLTEDNIAALNTALAAASEPSAFAAARSL